MQAITFSSLIKRPHFGNTQNQETPVAQELPAPVIETPAAAPVAVVPAATVAEVLPTSVVEAPPAVPELLSSIAASAAKKRFSFKLPSFKLPNVRQLAKKVWNADPLFSKLCVFVLGGTLAGGLGGAAYAKKVEAGIQPSQQVKVEATLEHHAADPAAVEAEAEGPVAKKPVTFAEIMNDTNTPVSEKVNTAATGGYMAGLLAFATSLLVQERRKKTV